MLKLEYNVNVDVKRTSDFTREVIKVGMATDI